MKLSAPLCLTQHNPEAGYDASRAGQFPSRRRYSGEDSSRKGALSRRSRISGYEGDAPGRCRCHDARGGEDRVACNEWERRGGVFARITRFEGPPERIDELRYAVVERAMPAVRRLEGFAGAMLLADRKSGKVQVLVMWESEQAMNATEESAYWFRAYSAEAANETVTEVERYEMIFSELDRVRL